MNQKNSHNKLRHQLNKKKLKILHQNIRGIKNKVDEFLSSLSPNVPQIICLSEHNLRKDEISKINFSQYTVGTSFCRQTYSHGGVCVLVHRSILFNPINLNHCSKDLEICALKFNIDSKNFIIICIYRSPAGIFFIFFKSVGIHSEQTS
jgi:exonuclease III